MAVDDDQGTGAAEPVQPHVPAPNRSVQLAFTDGFADDTAVVRIDGAVAYELEGVTTLQLLGLADERSLAVPDHPVTVEIELPGRGLTASTTVDPETSALSISVEGEVLLIRPHRQALGFA